jgi:hypothetical protein
MLGLENVFVVHIVGGSHRICFEYLSNETIKIIFGEEF